MQTAVVLALLVAAAFAQTRPTISEDFYAEVSLEEHLSNGVALFGQGRWAIDTTQNKAVEDYQFQDEHQQPFYVFNLARYDLGFDYTLDSFNRTYCNKTVLTGNMPSTWGWVALATFTGQHYYRNHFFDTWTYNAAGITLVLGVNPPQYDVPAFLIQNGTGFEVFITFERFYASQQFQASYFDVPPQCGSVETPVSFTIPKATPTRPNISEIFEAETRVESFANHTTTYGQGLLASNQPAGQFVEHYDLETRDSRDALKVFNLRRYDLGEEYLIESTNYSDCRSRAVTGSMPPFWSWLALATYEGQRYVRDYGLLDIWNYVAGGVNITLAVDDRFVNYPLFLARESSTFAIRYDFVRFTDQAPQENDFYVPNECKN